MPGTSLVAQKAGIATVGQNSSTMMKNHTPTKRKPLNAESAGDRSAGSESMTYESPVQSLIAKGGDHNLPMISGTTNIVKESRGKE